MVDDLHAAAPAAASPPATSRTVTIGGEPRTVERVSSAKAARMLAIVRAAGKTIPGILHKWGEFRSEYERTHSVELNRAQALAQYPPRPGLNEETGEPMRNADGSLLMVPGPLAALTEADWEASGNVYRIPESPSFAETVPAILPEVLELAEEHVYRLLALVLMPNREVAAEWRAGTIKDTLSDRAMDLLADSYPEELVELAVVAGELVDQQFRRKAEELGGRLGNALRLFGLDPAKLTPQTTEQAPQTPTTTEEETTASTAMSTPSQPSSSPSLSTDTPAPTDGDGTPSSTPPSTSSTNSGDSNEPMPSETPETAAPREAATA